MDIERFLVAPLLDQKDVLVVFFWQHLVELQAAVLTARADAHARYGAFAIPMVSVGGKKSGSYRGS